MPMPCSEDGKTKCQNTLSGYTCKCGNCYNEFVDKDGVASCKPKCNLKNCDQATGICQTSDGDSFPIQPSNR